MKTLVAVIGIDLSEQGAGTKRDEQTVKLAAKPKGRKTSDGLA
jgi:hypothetical protein